MDATYLRASEISGIDRVIDLVEHQKAVSNEKNSWREMYYGCLIRVVLSLRVALRMVQFVFQKGNRESPRGSLYDEWWKRRILPKIPGLLEARRILSRSLPLTASSNRFGTCLWKWCSSQPRLAYQIKSRLPRVDIWYWHGSLWFDSNLLSGQKCLQTMLDFFSRWPRDIKHIAIRLLRV